MQRGSPVSESFDLRPAAADRSTLPASVLEGSDAVMSTLRSLSSADLQGMGARDVTEAPLHVRAAVQAYAAFNRRDLENAVPPLDETRTCTRRDEVRGRLAELLRAFPDLTVRDLCAFDLGAGRVAVRFRFTGPNAGALGPDAPPTGRYFEAEMLDVVQFDAAGRIVDGRNLSDVEPIRQQLGVA